MKLTMTRVLTPLAALAFTLGAQATDFAKDDFEGQWSNSTGGYSFTAGPDQAADATAQYTYDGDAPAAAISPIAGATNTKGLKLSTEDGILFRNLTSATVGASGLYVDTDVQFTLTDKSDRPTPVTEGNDTDKFIIWLEADEDAGTTNLCVWAREYKLDNGEIVVNSNKVYKLESGEIVPGTWHRLTVKAIAQSNSDTLAIPGFQVYLDNNQTPLASTEYFCPAEDTTAEPTPFQDLLVDNTLFLAKTFFPAMADGLESLAKVGFSGEGKIDDFVVTDDIPSSLPRVALTVNWDATVVSNVTFLANGGSKTLTSSGSLLTLEPGSTVSFSMENIVPAEGVNLAQYSLSDDYNDWLLDGVAEVTVAAGVATVGGLTGNGAFTIALNRNTASSVFVDWSGVAADSIASVSYTIDGTTEVVAGAETYAMFDAELDDVITFSVALNQGIVGVPLITATTGATGSGSTFTLTGNSVQFSIALVTPVATVDGTSYATFAEAFAAAKTAGEPVVLCDDVTLTEAQEVLAAETVTVDLNGYTITGAPGEAAFENAGTLTITDESQNHGGSVVAGTGGSVVYNEGALALVYGYYAGDFVNTDTFTITTDCTFDSDLGRSYTAPVGYEMAETSFESGIYKLTLLTYNIIYMNGENQLSGLTPTTYTVTNNVTLPTEVDLGVVGVTFTGWKDGEDNTIASWNAGERTGKLTVYAQTTALVAEYTITYMYGDTVLEGLTPSNYTEAVAVTLPSEVNLGVVGVSFQAWTNAEGTVVAGWSAGDKNGNQTFYAQVSAVVPPSGTEPGAAVDGSPFASAEAAAAAANSATFKVPDVVAAALTSEQQSAYATLFHAKVGEPVDGQYPVTMELTGEGAATVQSSADLAVAALATNLTAAATAAQQVTVAAQPGFYYSIEAGTEVNNLAEPQQRTLATGDTVTLTMPTLGTKGFYRVKISYEQLSPAPNSGE